MSILQQVVDKMQTILQTVPDEMLKITLDAATTEMLDIAMPQHSTKL